MTTKNYKRLLLSLLAGFMLASCSEEATVPTAGSSLTDAGASGLSLRSVSTQSWLVTGGDVLLEAELQSGELQTTGMELQVNGEPASAAMMALSSQRVQMLLENLPEGDSTVSLALPAQGLTASLEISNYPIAGPIISGPHETPFYCQTTDFELVSGGKLGPALDSDCFVPTRVDYVYLSQNDGEFKAWPPESADGEAEPGSDLALISTADGGSIPYIVRVETGVVNRAIYEIAMLHDPDSPAPGPFNRSANWNGKLVYTHGGGCRSGWYQQGDRTGGVMRDGLLRMGYALVSASLNVFGQNCNDLLASETHIMVKERFIEHYGEPIYTIATGASGGSYQSHQTADNYPGVFDGLIVAASFPDVTSATIFTLADARLLHYYFNEINPDGFDPQQQQAVAGFGRHASIANLARGAARLDPIFEEGIAEEQQGGEVSIPALEERRYHPAAANGVRATVYDHTVNVYGRLDGTTIARRPLDNVGVQYGLGALNNGHLSVQQFLDLNRDIGGFDYDMNHVPERHQADRLASQRAIESGRILFGGAGLATTPVIDYRSYTDHRDGGDIHMIVHQFSTRQRMVQANGSADNHVMKVGGRWGFTEEEPDLAELFRQMDAWLMAIANDQSDQDARQKMLANKPQDLMDSCWDNRDGQPVEVFETQTYIGDGLCNGLYPAYPTPRHVAGAPLANDIVSCVLRPLSRSDYAVSFSDEQWQQLQTIFPGGVCDWSRGDASASIHQGVWASFGPSPVNRLY
ncbi:MAG: tannase/feruloyl esterase family alpha/beta hydrolase [Pseudomonadales bacterium]|nr:tannase/feruloyl esterase family alpha/beta hydrolase [Pseudomonadales bacterium]